MLTIFHTEFWYNWRKDILNFLGKISLEIQHLILIAKKHEGSLTKKARGEPKGEVPGHTPISRINWSERGLHCLQWGTLERGVSVYCKVDEFVNLGPLVLLVATPYLNKPENVFCLVTWVRPSVCLPAVIISYICTTSRKEYDAPRTNTNEKEHH